MPRPSFGHATFLAAARDLVAQAGPAAVTVSSVTERLGAPSGSFYYRFASRDVLLAELWLATALAFQEGFVAAIKAGDGLTAALHTPIWVRAHLDDARVFLLHHRDDFVHGSWPEALKLHVKQQARRIDACYLRFARTTLGGVDAERIRLARFVLADVPKAAVGSHLRRGEPPPPIVDKMIAVTYRAILAQYGRRPDGARANLRLDSGRRQIARRVRSPAKKKEADR
jgi:AcrR family transcriptional regulator